MPRKKPKRGRPRKPRGTKYATPMRSIRIPDDQWEAIATAAAASGQTVSDWIRTVLTLAVRRKTN